MYSQKVVFFGFWSEKIRGLDKKSGKNDFFELIVRI